MPSQLEVDKAEHERNDLLKELERLENATINLCMHVALGPSRFLTELVRTNCQFQKQQKEQRHLG